jgi:hypothetical protein
MQAKNTNTTVLRITLVPLQQLEQFPIQLVSIPVFVCHILALGVENPHRPPEIPESQANMARMFHITVRLDAGIRRFVEEIETEGGVRNPFVALREHLPMIGKRLLRWGLGLLAASSLFSGAWLFFCMVHPTDHRLESGIRNRR